MRRLVLLVASLAILMPLSACFDGGGPSTDNFVLQFTVQDTDGRPVPGLEARLHVPIPEIWDILGAKPAVSLQFCVPVQAAVSLVIYDLDGAQVRTLVDGELPAGMHQVVFDGKDDAGNRLLGTVVLQGHLVIREPGGGATLHENWVHPVLYTSLDHDQAPVLGTTNAKGFLRTLDRRLFPYLRDDLPPLVLRDEEANDRGLFTISDEVQIFLIDPQTGERQTFQVSAPAGYNDHVLVWDPAPVEPPPAAAPAPAGVPLPPATDDIKAPPLECTGQIVCYPNPFN